MPPWIARHRRWLERGWIVASTAYGGLRIFVADHTVARYGVNIYAFATVELSSSIVYGLGTAKLVGAVLDRRRKQALRWAAFAAVGFCSPETFVAVTGKHMPPTIYLALATILTTMGTVGVVTLVRRIRLARAAAALPAGEPAVAITPP